MNSRETALNKADTVALWHAVKWMEICVRQPPSEGESKESIDAERERLRTAKRALRKVNAIRKLQAKRESAGDAGGTAP